MKKLFVLWVGFQLVFFFVFGVFGAAMKSPPEPNNWRRVLTKRNGNPRIFLQLKGGEPIYRGPHEDIPFWTVTAPMLVEVTSERYTTWSSMSEDSAGYRDQGISYWICHVLSINPADMVAFQLNGGCVVFRDIGPKYTQLSGQLEVIPVFQKISGDAMKMWIASAVTATGLFGVLGWVLGGRRSKDPKPAFA